MTARSEDPATGAPYLTERHAELRRSVREQLELTLLPHADRFEAQGFIDAEGWRALGKTGLLALAHRGADFLDSAILLDELGRLGYAGIRAAIGVHTYMAPAYLHMFGRPEQQVSYLWGVRDGSRIAALAISEDQAGSDLRHLTTRADPRDDGTYLLRGVKQHIVNGSQADFFVVLAKTSDAGATRGLAGASLLIVDADLPGVSRSPQPMLGWRSSDICRVEFDDVPVPADRLIGRREFALRYLVAALDFERLVAGLLAVGGAAHAVDLLDSFVRRHRVKDAPLAANQAVRHRVASLTAELELARQYAYHVSWTHSAGRLGTRSAAVVKLTATELASRAAQALLQCHGARGLLADAVPARVHRDAVAGTIAAGPSELMLDLIFEAG